MEKDLTEMNYRCWNLHKTMILCFGAYSAILLTL